MLGHCGAVFKQDIDELIQYTGMSETEAYKMCEELHENAVQHTYTAACKHNELRVEELKKQGKWTPYMKKGRPR